MTQAALASLVARRLCHDFAGPVGAVTTALDMMADGSDPELLSLVTDSAASLSASLRLYRFTLAPSQEPASSGVARDLFADWAKAQEGITLDWAGGADDWPAGVAELTTGLGIIAVEAAQRGGRLTVTQGRVRVETPLLVVEPDLAQVLGGALQPSTTRLAIAGVIAAQAAAAGLAIRVEPDAEGLTLTAYQGSEAP
jgi:histidine phosphotransferase ChpT